MYKRQVFGCIRPNAKPSMYALYPTRVENSMRKIDDGPDFPEGFMLIRTPWLDDIRGLPNHFLENTANQFTSDEDDDLGLFGRNACWYGNDADHKPRTLESSGGASSDVNRSMSTLLSSSEGSLNESIFDNERRPSVATTTNSLVLSINVAKNNAYVISINNLKFVSYEKFYTVLEKQYISNCIPDLNSYDRWNGKDLTLSNYKYFVGKGSTVGKGKKKGIFIPYNDFIDHTSSYEKKRIFSGNHIKNQRIGSCHSFRIYQMGLVGVQPEERADVIPVSYTHLDVYKRQSLSWTKKPFWWPGRMTSGIALQWHSLGVSREPTRITLSWLPRNRIW